MASVTIVSGAIAVSDADQLEREPGSGSPIDRKFWMRSIRRVPRIHASPIHSTIQEIVE
jgi:hypothetical protein